MNNTCRVFLLRIIIIIQITPKYFSKNTFNFSITVFFFSCLLPPPKRDIAGSILSISVPVVRIAPSRKAFSTNLAVSSAFHLLNLLILSYQSHIGATFLGQKCTKNAIEKRFFRNNHPIIYHPEAFYKAAI